MYTLLLKEKTRKQQTSFNIFTQQAGLNYFESKKKTTKKKGKNCVIQFNAIEYIIKDNIFNISFINKKRFENQIKNNKIEIKKSNEYIKSIYKKIYKRMYVFMTCEYVTMIFKQKNK